MTLPWLFHPSHPSAGHIFYGELQICSQPPQDSSLVVGTQSNMSSPQAYHLCLATLAQKGSSQDGHFGYLPGLPGRVLVTIDLLRAEESYRRPRNVHCTEDSEHLSCYYRL